MLNANQSRLARAPHRAKQHGVVLFIALIVLVAMTLAGIGLMRSVYTSNRIAGNLAFQQSATQSADAGVETAVAWLEDQSAVVPVAPNLPPLFNNIDRVAVGDVGYFASRQNPGANQTWEQFWTVLPANRVNTLPADAAGNTVSYVIQRLCNAVGDPTTGIGCEASPDTASGGQGNSKGPGLPGLKVPTQRYYRITVRVAGPRNTVSFVQTVVAL